MTDLGLDRFLEAARQGMLVWVQGDDTDLAVCSGDRPDPAARTDVGALLAAALREHCGTAAGQLAEQEFGLVDRPQRVLPARTVIRAVACAEAALSVQMAQATVLRFEFSAEHLGRYFRHLCRELGIEPSGLSLERRRAMDQAVQDCFGGLEPASADAARQRLVQLLTQGLH